MARDSKVLMVWARKTRLELAHEIDRLESWLELIASNDTPRRSYVLQMQDALAEHIGQIEQLEARLLEEVGLSCG